MDLFKTVNLTMRPSEMAEGETATTEKSGAHFNIIYSLSIVNSTFENLTAEKGGAIALTNADKEFATKLTILNSLFKGNYATKEGGAVHIDGHTLGQVETSTFLMNRVDKETGKGGGMFYSCNYFWPNC